MINSCKSKILLKSEEIKMACLIVPAAEAVVTTIAEKVIKSKEKEN